MSWGFEASFLVCRHRNTGYGYYYCYYFHLSVMAGIVMPYIVMAYMVMAYKIMAHIGHRFESPRQELSSGVWYMATACPDT